MKEVRIALVDDQKLFRQSLSALLAVVPVYQVVMEAESGTDCLTQLSAMNILPDIILMDMEMPGMDGIELNESLQKKYPAIKVIVLSMHAKERLISRMIESGACGYLIKNCDKEELLAAIHTVAETGFYINTQVLKAIQGASGSRTKSRNNLAQLSIEFTPREKEVLILICKEYTNAEIANKLFISIRTTEGHRTNLLAKTGCHNTAGLVLFAVKTNLFEVSF
ncbi:MAG: response regulator transcription factor [Bacteroidota bacterium]